MIFLDSSFIISYKIENDENHDKSLIIMKKIVNGKYGIPIISDYIFDEFVTVLLNKAKSLSISVNSGNELIDSTKMLTIDEEAFEKAWEIFKKQKNTKFSFTDCSTLALMKKEDINNIATFDKDFKKLNWISVVN